MKKVLAMTLALTLAFGAVALPAVEGGVTFNNGISASAEETSDGFEYEVNDDETVTITGYTGNNGNVTIPSTINGMKVTGIRDSAFEDYSRITSIKISDGVTSIGDSAFRGCSNLTSVTIPDTVTSIGWRAFYDCPNLKKVTIPQSVTSIDDCAFGYYFDDWKVEDTKIDGFTITCYKGSCGIIYARNNGFKYTIANPVASDYKYSVNDDGETITIDEYYGNNSDLIIPETIDEKKVTDIGDSVFRKCLSLTSIIIPNSVTSIGDFAFEGCTSLKSIKISDSVTSIGEWTFYGCSSLTSITIPDSVTSIGDWAFRDCSSLTNVTIPDSVTSIGGYAFYGCSSLTSVTVDLNNKNYTSKDGVLFNKNKTELIQYPTGNTRQSYTIPDSVTSIEDSVFYRCSSLTSITIPDSVTSIGDSAFFGCSSLKDVYYTGTKEQWNKISIGVDNDNFKNATIHYNYVVKHSFSKWTVTKKPTCTTKGEQQRKCSDCGKIEKQTINALGHNLVKIKVVKPTLKSKGYTLYKCSNCGGTIKNNYISALVSISKAKVTGIKDITYTGKQIKPKITVKVGKTTLKNGRDYTVSYGKNKSIGKGTVTITGKGKYGSKITKSFKILPAKTSAKLSSTKGKIKVTLKKAKGAKKYLIQISSNSKFRSAKTVSTTAIKKSFKAKSKKIYYVRVRSVNGKYLSGWSAVKKIKVK